MGTVMWCFLCASKAMTATPASAEEGHAACETTYNINNKWHKTSSAASLELALGLLQVGLFSRTAHLYEKSMLRTRDDQ